MSLAPDPVLLEVSPEGVAVVTLNRPDKRNAFDEFVVKGLTDAFETLKGADHVRIVFLRGAGEMFCAGGDIEWMRRQGAHDRADNEADAMALANMLKALNELPQMSVAMVQGGAYGGGLGLMAACDVVVATQDAKFRFSEVRLGLVPAIISPYVLAAIGPRWTRALFVSAENFDGRLAERIGLAHFVTEDSAAMDAIAERLSDLAFSAAPGAVAQTKALLREVEDDVTRLRNAVLPAQAGAGHVIDRDLLHTLAKRLAERRASDEGREGLAAFLEKRKPRWES